jgi:hypothetical protein
LLEPAFSTTFVLCWSSIIFSSFALVLSSIYPYLRLPLWSCGQGSCLQIQRSGFHSQRYQIFWEVVGLEQGQLSLVSTIEELFGRKSSCPGLEKRHYCLGVRCADYTTPLYPQKLALTLPTSGGRSVGIVRSRTKATELLLSLLFPFAACFALFYGTMILTGPPYLFVCLRSSPVRNSEPIVAFHPTWGDSRMTRAHLTVILSDPYHK